jgi:hypothetical protein
MTGRHRVALSHALVITMARYKLLYGAFKVSNDEYFRAGDTLDLDPAFVAHLDKSLFELVKAEAKPTPKPEPKPDNKPEPKPDPKPKKDK